MHALVVTGLLHHHFHIGLHIPHAILHMAESGGLVLAVISTLAAAGAELLAIRRALLPRRDAGMAAPAADPLDGQRHTSGQHHH
jgi:hypothetical protein